MVKIQMGAVPRQKIRHARKHHFVGNIQTLESQQTGRGRDAMVIDPAFIHLSRTRSDLQKIARQSKLIEKLECISKEIRRQKERRRFIAAAGSGRRFEDAGLDAAPFERVRARETGQSSADDRDLFHFLAADKAFTLSLRKRVMILSTSEGAMALAHARKRLIPYGYTSTFGFLMHCTIEAATSSAD